MNPLVRRLVVLVVTLLAATAARAEAPERREVFELDGFLLFPQSVDIDTVAGGTPISRTVDTDVGGTVGVIYGTRLFEYLRFDIIDFSFRQQSLAPGASTSIPIGLEQHVRTFNLMWNAWITGKQSWRVIPFAGGGVGIGFTTFTQTGGGLPSFESSSTEFAWNAGGGIEIPLNERVRIVPRYRAVSNKANIFDPLTASAASMKILTHELTIGLQANF